MSAPDEWDVTPAEAVAIQHRLRGAVRAVPLPPVRLVAGTDLSADRQRGEVHAGVVVVDLLTGETVDSAVVTATTEFPYVPGLLSFRELPALDIAWRRLRVKPDAVLCDGQGLAHPRRFGLACHAGVRWQVPAVGCAKSRLVGEADPPGAARGAWAPLRDDGETIGAVVRTRAGVKPVYVSIGHLCTLADAIDLVLRCVGRYRLPEPTRRAHALVNDHRRAARCEST